MNILYYDWKSNSNNDIYEAFSRMGIWYEIFQYPVSNYEQDSKFSEHLENVLHRGKFDAIFSFDYIPVIAYTAQKYKVLYFSWIYDCPHHTLFSNSAYSEYNRIFVFDKIQCDYFRARGVKNVFHMPLAVNVEKYNKLLGTDIENTEYLHDISFIGSLYNDNLYNHIEYLPEYLKGYLYAMLQSQKKIYGYDLMSELLTDEVIGELQKYISFGDDVAIDIPYKELFLDILYVKLAELERKNVLEVCGKYAQVALYTGSDSENICKDIKTFSPVDYNTQLPILYRKSKINLNITCRSIVSGIPMRVLDVMASGGFLVSNYQQELAEYFVPGEEVVLYESMEDLKSKIQYYLKHEEERKRIAIKGYQKVQREFSYDIALRKMFRIAMAKNDGEIR